MQVENVDAGSGRLSKPKECGHCGNYAPLEKIAAGHVNLSEDSESGFWEMDDYEIYVCFSCRKAHLVTTYSCSDMPEWAASEILLYPPQNKQPDGLPAGIAKTLLSAERFRRVDSNSFGVLLRRVLEMVCEDRGAVGRNLKENIEDLAKNREIPDKLVKVAHSLRDLGNVGAHPKLGELTVEDAPAMYALCRAILEYVYSAPHLASQAEKLMTARSYTP